MVLNNRKRRERRTINAIKEYQEIRELVSRIVPGNRPFFPTKYKGGPIKEKGRKKNYYQYNLLTQQWEKKERLLDTEQINSFLEISLRAAACPMPFNADVWDGLNCIAEGQKVKTKRGEIPIEEVRPGDEVLTFNEVTGKTEWKTVVNTSRSIRRDLVEIETEKGKLLVTEDHPVFTQRGWVRAGELTDEDVLYTY